MRARKTSSSQTAFRKLQVTFFACMRHSEACKGIIKHFVAAQVAGTLAGRLEPSHVPQWTLGGPPEQVSRGWKEAGRVEWGKGWVEHRKGG